MSSNKPAQDDDQYLAANSIFSIRLFGQTYTYNGLIQHRYVYRIEVTNT